MFLYVFRQQLDAFLGLEINDFDAVFAQPIDSTVKIYRLPHDDGSDSKLTNQSAAVPARGKGCDHDFVAIGSLEARAAKRVSFAMCRRVAFLHSSIVASSQERSFASEKSCANGDSTFGKADARFC